MTGLFTITYENHDDPDQKLFGNLIFRLLLLLIIFQMGLTVSAQTDSSKVLKIRGDSDYPPFEFIDKDGSPSGYVVELFQAVAKEAGIQYQLRLGPWSVVTEQLNNKEIDGLVGLLYTDYREQFVDFSEPFLTLHHSIFVRENSMILSEEDLTGKTILVQNGHVLEEYLTDKGLASNLVLVKSQPEGLRLLAAGQYDCFVGGKLESMYTIWTEGIDNIKSTGEPICPRHYAFAVTEGNQELQTKLNEGLETIRDSGEFDQLYAKWFQGMETRNSQFQITLQYIVITAGILVVLLLLSIFWTAVLKKQVARKTREIEKELSARQEIENALTYSQNQLRILIDTIPDLVWMKDMNGVYRFCNPTFERFFGASESEIIAKTDYDFVDKDLADFFRLHDKRAIEANQPSCNEEELIFADGSYQGTFETIKTPVRDTEGRILGVLGIARDISERKQAVMALKLNEERYKAAQRMGKVGNWEYEIKTGLFWGSDESKRIYGLDPEDKNFTTEDVESCIPDREQIHQALLNLIEKNEPYDLEFKVRPADGSNPKIIQSIAELVVDQYGNAVKVVGVIQDITLQKKAEREKLQLEKRIRQAERLESLGNLAGGIAHDFNNILSSILGFTELSFDAAEGNSQICDYLEEVIIAGTRAKNLVRQILAFASLSNEQSEPVIIRTVVSEVMGLLRSSIPSTIKIVCDIDTDSVIMGNSTEIHQIMMNLCTNAASAMDDNGGVLTVILKDAVIDDLERSDKENAASVKFVELTISDNGCGMSDAVQKSAFEPFFTTKAPGKGTGMGLAVVHGIVQRYGGSIELESAEEQGTTIRIYLPVANEISADFSVEKEVIVGGDERILIIDDEFALLKSTALILTSLGYVVTTETSATAALEMCRKDPQVFDLVITDLTMPEMTGIKLAEQLFKIRSDFPVILCTGYGGTVSEKFVQELGIKLILRKPVLRNDLATAVRSTLDSVTGLKIKPENEKKS